VKIRVIRDEIWVIAIIFALSKEPFLFIFKTNILKYMKILTEKQIHQKIKRLTIEILEHNFDADEIILAGINNNGLEFAQLLMNELLTLQTAIPITLTRIRLSPADPLGNPIFIEMPLQQLENKTVILIDDVANTGRTVFYALKPLMEILPKKVEVAVLVDRKHKMFPITPDYVGLSLATTLKENIEVQLKNVAEKAVYLK
jgi:pyrimidine operon attenuation protein / uracil phosphoribosyltransferase